MKKAWNALVALIATLGMAVAGFVGVSSAYADDNTTAKTYKISVPSDDNHEYEIYQIFTGDLSDDGTVLSNIKAGVNYKGTDAVADAETIANTIAGDATDQDKLAVIKNYVDLDSAAFETVASGASVDVPAGYYLIKDKNGSLDGKDDAYTTYIVQVVGDTEIQRKATKPTVEKKVKDVNDTTGETSDWQDSADADIDDQVEFQLTATLPTSETDFAAYSTYALSFHDTMSKGLTFESGTVKVTVNGKELTRGDNYKVEVPGTEGATFDINIENIKAVDGIKAGDKVVVTYEAKLNSDAVIGKAGNPNDVELEYSNNPNTDGKGKTPKDRVKVFTYEVDVNKTQKDGEPLKNAGFTLFKKLDDGTWKQVGAEVMANAGADANQAVFKGLDDGDYKLEETTVPDGYNKCEDVLFTIDAEHDANSDDPQLTSLTSTGKLTADAETGIVSGEIVNVPGSNLPETGGMGTTLLYVAGAVIVVVAGLGLAMVMRKRNAR